MNVKEDLEFIAKPINSWQILNNSRKNIRRWWKKFSESSHLIGWATWCYFEAPSDNEVKITVSKDFVIPVDIKGLRFEDEAYKSEEIESQGQRQMNGLKIKHRQIIFTEYKQA